MEPSGFIGFQFELLSNPPARLDRAYRQLAERSRSQRRPVAHIVGVLPAGGRDVDEFDARISRHDKRRDYWDH